MMSSHIETSIAVTTASVIATIAYFGLRGQSVAAGAIIGMFAWLYTEMATIIAAATLVPLLLSCFRPQPVTMKQTHENDEVIDGEFVVMEVQNA